VIRPGKMLLEVLEELLKKPATISYPARKVQMPPRFRGKLVFRAEKCIGCRLCMKDCPSEAIQINKLGDKLFEAIVDLERCVFCGQCVDSCNQDALETSDEYELASLDKAKLKVRINRD
jgi:formate hydrogenlyase subunit 6/NADH:ubiquinone oxidoreductase subunit I